MAALLAQALGTLKLNLAMAGLASVSRSALMRKEGSSLNRKLR